MKRIKYCLVFCSLVLFAFSSCVNFDNYDEPKETLKGSIYVKGTNKTETVQTEGDGSNGIRIRMLDYGWSDNPTQFYLNVMQDGTYNNTRVFKSKYNIEVFGPFVPILQYGSDGKVTVDERKTVEVSGTTVIDWEVEPLLKLEWVGEPVVNAAGTNITASFKITRGTTNPNYQQNVTDIYLFVNSSSYHVGNHNHDSRYQARLQNNAAQSAFATGDVITLTTGGSFSPNRDYYIRVGARTSLSVEGVQRYNYTTPKLVKVLSR